MKYNLDCARDILFLLEDAQTISTDLEICVVSLHEIASQLNKYKLNEIANTLIILDDAEFICADAEYASNCIQDILVSRITYEGYQFLESIRPEPVWQKIKNVCFKVGSYSFNAISQIALSTISSYVRAELGL